MRPITRSHTFKNEIVIERIGESSLHILFGLRWWLCLHHPHWGSCWGHRFSDWKPLYLLRALVFIFKPINPFLKDSRHMLPNSSEQLIPQDLWQQWCGAISSLFHFWGKGLSQESFSISLLLPTSPLPAAGVFQGIPVGARFFIRLAANSVSHSPALRRGVWVPVSVEQSCHWEQSEDCFQFLQGSCWTGNS